MIWSFQTTLIEALPGKEKILSAADMKKIKGGNNPSVVGQGSKVGLEIVELESKAEEIRRK